MASHKHHPDRLEIRANDGNRWYSPDVYPYKIVVWQTSATAVLDRKTNRRVPDTCKTVAWCKSKKQAERWLKEMSLDV